MIGQRVRGKSEEWLGAALKGKRDRAFVMTKVCTHGRDKALAMKVQMIGLEPVQGLLPYKGSLKFDNPEARLAHVFPLYQPAPQSQQK